MEPGGASSQDDTAFLSRRVRESDRPRYHATLFAPRDVQADLFALYGFAAEIERVADQITDPDLGEIRLQWWRDSLEDAQASPGQAEAPAVRALSLAMARRALPLDPFLALIEAHRDDLYSDAPPTIADLEGTLGETQSSLFQLAVIVLGGSGAETADAAGHAGVAYGLTRHLAGFAAERAEGRMPLPATVLAEQGITPEDIFAAAPGLEPQGPVAKLTLVAEEHLRQAREYLEGVPRPVLPAFLPLAVVEPLLTKVAELGPDIMTTEATISDLQSLARIAWARLRNRP